LTKKEKKKQKMETKSRIIKFAIPAIFVLFGLAAYQYGYVKIQEETASIREIQIMKNKTLGKYITIIAEKPLLENKLVSLKEKRKADDSKIIEGQTFSLSANTLEDIVKGIIVGRGGSIVSERVEKPDDLGKFKIVNVSIDLFLPEIQALSDIIYSIETRTPYIVVRELDVRVKNIKEPRELMVKLRIAALTEGK
jgi:hypothetical protein